MAAAPLTGRQFAKPLRMSDSIQPFAAQLMERAQSGHGVDMTSSELAVQLTGASEQLFRLLLNAKHGSCDWDAVAAASVEAGLCAARIHAEAVAIAARRAEAKV